MSVIEEVQQRLEELRIIVPDTIGGLYEEAGFEQIYVALIGLKGQVVQKTLSPLTRMPSRATDTFAFTVNFYGPFDPVAYVTLMEGERENPDFVFRPNVASRKFVEGETYVITLRLLPRYTQ